MSAGVGASALGSGAVDDVPWEELVHAARILGEPPSRDAAHPLSLAGGRRSPPSSASGMCPRRSGRGSPPWPAASARPAAAIARCSISASSKARSCSCPAPIAPAGTPTPWPPPSPPSAFARARRLVFRAGRSAGAPLRRRAPHRRRRPRHPPRRRGSPRLARRRRLREGLAATREGAGAILLGPWLGAASPPRAEALSAAVGLPCGEALVGVGSPAGLRFEAARDRLLDTLGVRHVRDRVTRVSRAATLTVSLARSEAPLTADAVVLALGGIAGGGVVYAPPEHLAGTDLAPAAKLPFELSLAAPVVLSAGGDAPRWGSSPRCTGPSSTSRPGPSTGAPAPWRTSASAAPACSPATGSSRPATWWPAARARCSRR